MVTKVTVRIPLKMFSDVGARVGSACLKTSSNPEADKVWTPKVCFRVPETCLGLVSKEN